VQYAHAASAHPAAAEEQGYELPLLARPIFLLLEDECDLNLIRKMVDLTDVIICVALTLAAPLDHYCMNWRAFPCFFLFYLPGFGSGKGPGSGQNVDDKRKGGLHCQLTAAERGQRSEKM
jgi:hypothetical protein